jgi:hypothetical protein
MLGIDENADRILVCKPEGKESFPRRCWGDNIKMHLEDIGCKGVVCSP